MESRQYRRNFLTNVIVRADFAAPLIGATDSWPVGITKTVLKGFPIEEERTAVQMMNMVPVAMSGSFQPPNVTSDREMHYYSLDRDYHLGLGRSFLFVETSKYKDFASLQQLFEPVAKDLFNSAPDLAVKRLGLRYINVISAAGKNPLQWSGIVNPKLSSMLGFVKDSNRISRAIGNMEFNFDGIGLRLQYGVLNPDYPAVVKRKEFVLDMDAFSPGLASFGQMMDQLRALHEHVETVFENAIGGKLRKAMMIP